MPENEEETEEPQPTGETNPDEEAEAKVAALEDDPPQNLEDWPDDEAKYKTFGGPEGDTSYEEGPTSKLGESEVRHLEDGTVTVGGEEVDNPDDYKGDPIPGGPTDPDAASLSGEKDLTGESEKREEDRGAREDQGES